MLLAALAGIICYLLLEFVFGPAGVLAYQDALTHRTRLEEHIAELELIGEEFQSHITGLRTDSETIRVAARRMGLVEAGEQMVYVEGYASPSAPSSAGTVLARPVPYADHRPFLRALALSIAIALYLVLVILDIVRNRAGETVQEEPVPEEPATQQAQSTNPVALRALVDQEPRSFEGDLDLEPIEFAELPYSNASPRRGPERKPFEAVPRAE